MNFLIKLLITAAVAYFLTRFLPGVSMTNFTAAIVFAIILAILNLILKPFLKLIGLPFTILTLGLFSLVINALVVLAADYFVDGMNINGFVNALIFSVALSFLSSILNAIFTSENKNR